MCRYWLVFFRRVSLIFPACSLQALANAAEFASSAEFAASAAANSAVVPGIAATAAPQFLRFGDGSPVPLEPLLAARCIADEDGVTIEWQAGDVALLDNFTVMHARRAFEGPRKLFAAFVV